MKKTISLIKDTLSHWQSKRASRMGAAISFYAIFSIAPFFILIINLVSSIFDHQTVLSTVHRTLVGAVGTSLADLIQSLITGLQYSKVGTIGTIVSIAILVIGALSMFSELNNDLDELWYVAPKEKKDLTIWQTVTGYIREQVSIFFLILLCGLLLLFSVAFTVFLSLIQHTAPILQHILATGWALSAVNIILTLFFSTVVFTLMYRILPNTKLPWKELLIGAFVTAVLVLIGKFLISWYITAFKETKGYGTAASFVGFLLWVYYSAQVFFIGSSFTFIRSKTTGYLSRQNNN